LWPIVATTLGLTHHHSEAASLDSGFVVGSPDDVDHLAFFWNLRAAGADVVFLPEDDALTFSPVVETHVERILSRPSRWGGDIERLVHLWRPEAFGSTRNEPPRPVPDEVADLVRSTARLAVGTLDDLTWTQPSIGNLPPTAEPKSVLANFEERYGASHVSAAVGTGPFPEAEVAGPRGWQLWAWAIQSPPSELPGDLILRLPLLRDLNEWYSRSLMPAQPWNLRVQPNGLDLLVRVHDTALGIYPVHIDSLVEKLFDRAGLRIQRSAPGQVTQRIIEMMGGLPGCLLFKITGVRRLLGMTKSRNGITRNQAIQTIRDRDPVSRKASFDRFQRLLRDARPEDVLTRLLERGVFRVGLELICPNCRLRPFIEPARISDEVECPLCGLRFMLAPVVSGKEWRLRTSGVFEREGSPDGAIPSILAMAEVARVNALIGTTFVRPSCTIAIGEKECESDLIGIEISRDGDPVVVVAECKALGEVDADDVISLKEVRQLLRESGVECYLLFAVLREDFTDMEIAQFRELSDEFVGERHRGLVHEVAPAAPPILFTTRQLEGDPWIARAEEGPHAHPMSLREVAENSQAIYLGARREVPWPPKF
jgi:hypothetical protein